MKVIHVLRKPLSEKTVASNTVKHGTGGLNINACRIAAPGETISNHRQSDESGISKGIYGDSKGRKAHQTDGQKRGRWPANVILQHLDGCRYGACVEGCPVRALDEQSGITTNTSHYSYKRSGGEFIDGIPSQPEKDWWRTETGGASRFFKQVGGSK